MRLNPLAVIKEAISAVPAVKYALGIAGIVSVIALIRSYQIDSRVAVLGTIVILLMMVVLVIFARLSTIRSSKLNGPALVLTWFALFLMILVSFVLFTSVFFGWPRNLVSWIEVSARERDLSEGTVLVHEHRLYVEGPFSTNDYVELQGSLVEKLRIRSVLGYGRIGARARDELHEVELIYQHENIKLEELKELVARRVDVNSSAIIASVVEIDKQRDAIVINRGTNQRVEPQMYYLILGDPFTDNDERGTSLGRPVIGALQVIETQPAFSYCKIAEIKDPLKMNGFIEHPQNFYAVLTSEDNVISFNDAQIYWAVTIGGVPRHMREQRLRQSRRALAEISSGAPSNEIILKVIRHTFDPEKGKFVIDITLGNQGDRAHYLIDAIGLYLLDTKTTAEFQLLAYELRASMPVTPTEINFSLLDESGKPLFETTNESRMPTKLFSNDFAKQGLAFKLPPKEFDFVRIAIDLGDYSRISFHLAYSWSEAFADAQGDPSFTIDDKIFVLSRGERKVNLSELLQNRYSATPGPSTESASPFSTGLAAELARSETMPPSLGIFSLAELAALASSTPDELSIFTTLGRVPRSQVQDLIVKHLQTQTGRTQIGFIIASEEHHDYLKPGSHFAQSVRTELLKSLLRDDESSPFALRALKRYGVKSDLRTIMDYYLSHPDQHTTVASALTAIYVDDKGTLLALLKNFERTRDGTERMLEALAKEVESSDPKFQRMRDEL